MNAPARSSTRFLLVWLAFLFPLGVSLIGHWNYYFVEASEEAGDFGANALQIQNAKHFSEIHGNYSRFHFNHPGPAFFYVYALGEAVFNDAIPVARAPGAAHSLAGLLLQCAFFAAAIGVFARFFPRPSTILAALAIGSVHFFLTGSAFVSIWPPHQLLMPFFCALITAAAVAAGEISLLPLLTLSMCFCVHGHVAQPLFVVPVFCGSVICAGIRLSRRGFTETGPLAIRRVVRALFWNPAGVWSAFFVTIFVLPLAVDALRGRGSNFALILDYLHHPAAAHKPLGVSIVYFLSFMRYWAGLGAESTGSISANLLAYVGVYFGWLAALAGCGVWATQRGSAKNDATVNPIATDFRKAFVAAGLVITIFTSLLAIYWGTRIEEGMFAFNSFFIYAILALPLLFCIGIAGEYARVPLSVVGIGTAIIGLQLCVSVSSQILQQDSHVPVVDSPRLLEDFCRHAGLGELRAHSFIYLTFDHDEWVDAIAVADQISRAKLDFRVPADWGFVFGLNHVLQPRDSLKLRQALRVSVKTQSSAPSDREIQLHGPIYAEVGNQLATALDPAMFPTQVSVASPLFDRAFGLVSRDPNSDFVWSIGILTGFVIQPSASPGNVTIQLDLEPLVKPPLLDEQRFRVQFGTTDLGHYSLAGRRPVALTIPREVWNRECGPSHPVDLVFLWEDSTTPLHLDINNDRRPLAVGFRAITFRLESPVRKP